MTLQILEINQLISHYKINPLQFLID